MSRSSIASVVLAVALTVGCGGESAPDDPANAASDSSVPGNGQASDAESLSLAPGLMTAVHRQDNIDVLVFSAETGNLVDQRAIVYSGPSFRAPIGRANVSDDGRYVVWASGGRLFGAPCGDLHLAELDGRVATYHEAGRWQPPETSFSDGAICFQDPEFEDGGTIRVLGMNTGEVAPSENRHPGPEPDSVWTVDAERRDDPPEHVEDLTDDDIVRDVAVGVTGVADGSGEMAATASKIERLRVHVTDSPQGLPYDGSTYACHAHVDDTTMLCLLEDGGSGLFGSVATASVNMGSATVRLREVAPVTAARVTGGLVSPDRATVLIATNDGWFRGDMAGSTEPRPAFENLVDPASPEPIHPDDVEWID